MQLLKTVLPSIDWRRHHTHLTPSIGGGMVLNLTQPENQAKEVLGQEQERDGM